MFSFEAAGRYAVQNGGQQTSSMIPDITKWTHIIGENIATEIYSYRHATGEGQRLQACYRRYRKLLLYAIGFVKDWGYASDYRLGTRHMGLLEITVPKILFTITIIQDLNGANSLLGV